MSIRIVSLVILCATLLAPPVAEARRSKTPPKLTLNVLKGKKVIGREELRVKTGKKGEDGVTKSYVSTKSRLRDNGRTFGFRTHTVMDQKGRLLTYDRWIDVKGATLRRRVFSFKGAWKMVVFSQSRGSKNQLTELDVKGSLLVLDPRSPMLVAMAADRLIGKGETAFVNADTGKTGKLTMTAEHLKDAKGKHYVRFHLKGGAVAVSVLRDDKGNTLEIKGLGRYGGRVAKFHPGALQPATPPGDAAAPVDSAAAAGAVPVDSAVPVDNDTPIPPPHAAAKTAGKSGARKSSAGKSSAGKPSAKK